MFAAFRKAAPFAAIAVAAILAGCTVEAAPYPDVYAYSAPSTVFVDPCCYHYGFYGHYDHYYGPGYHGYGGGFHGGGGMHGRG